MMFKRHTPPKSPAVADVEASDLKEKTPVSNFADYQQRAMAWDSNQFRQSRALSFMLWIYSCIATIAIVALAFAIMQLTPLKTVEPYLIRVDSSTGIAETLSKNDLQNAKWSQSEQTALDRYFLAKYVIAREGYNYPLRNLKYKEVAVMSTEAVTQTYVDHVVTTNPDSPINKLGKNNIIDIKIKSISFPDTGKDTVAYVRFTRQVKNLNSSEEAATEHLLATINYRYLKAEISNEARQINPLGFTVSAYQLTEEVQ
jgi:type IV secretion system protein virB8